METNSGQNSNNFGQNYLNFGQNSFSSSQNGSHDGMSMRLLCRLFTFMPVKMCKFELRSKEGDY